MKKLYKKFILIFLAAICLYFSADAQDQKTSFNDAAAALSSKEIGNLFPMHDKQVNQIIRMCHKGQDIAGCVSALTSLGVYLGNEIDDIEEEVIIRGSKMDVALFNKIGQSIITSFSKPKTTSIVEANYILDIIESGKGNELLTGIKNLSQVKYRMRTGSELLINPSKLQLWVTAGNIELNQLQNVYSVMQTVGLQKEMNEISVTALIALVKTSKSEDIVKAVTTLSATGWRCEGELDEREQQVIENLINSVYVEEPKDQKSFSYNAETIKD